MREKRMLGITRLDVLVPTRIKGEIERQVSSHHPKLDGTHTHTHPHTQTQTHTSQRPIYGLASVIVVWPDMAGDG